MSLNDLKTGAGLVWPRPRPLPFPRPRSAWTQFSWFLSEGGEGIGAGDDIGDFRTGVDLEGEDDSDCLSSSAMISERLGHPR